MTGLKKPNFSYGTGLSNHEHFSEPKISFGPSIILIYGPKIGHNEISNVPFLLLPKIGHNEIKFEISYIKYYIGP